MLVDAQVLKMPALSPTMQEGTIVKWYKKEGTLNILVIIPFKSELHTDTFDNFRIS